MLFGWVVLVVFGVVVWLFLLASERVDLPWRRWRDPGTDEHEFRESSSSRYMLRRRVDRGTFEFVDDAAHTLGTMDGKSITTELGNYRRRGSMRATARLEDVRTGEIILRRDGKREFWRLPDGRRLTWQVTGANTHEARLGELLLPNGDVAVRLRWLAPLTLKGDFPLGAAELGADLLPTRELVPLIAYAFDLLQNECHPRGGAAG